ncbi:hypothetical protein DJ019_17065 [Phenylobacterium kunshanense]|uniref:Response regulatory domain-containing protein n=2 Tax=Phenylobacterium kunshanense TaxID=1445034 RepID=A0A328BAT7_9CAUL|nr:hypothetical protein DJ019_17065 [Phenylobacterium kunshanense]
MSLARARAAPKSGCWSRHWYRAAYEGMPRVPQILDHVSPAAIRAQIVSPSSGVNPTRRFLGCFWTACLEASGLAASFLGRAGRARLDVSVIASLLRSEGAGTFPRPSPFMLTWRRAGRPFGPAVVRRDVQPLAALPNRPGAFARRRNAMGRVLLVEDEPLVAELVRETLEDEGLDVRTLHSGRDALGCLAAEPRSFQVLVTDINLGDGVTGFDVAAAARAANPDVRVVYVTGLPSNIYAAEVEALMFPKPFDPLELAVQVRALACGDGPPRAQGGY